MEQLFRRASVRDRILANPLGPVLRRFADHLSTRGHSPFTVQQYVFAAEHFGNWIGSESVDHGSVLRFISVHLPRCKCAKPAATSIATMRAALNRLLEMLGRGAPKPAAPQLVATLLGEYEQHLRSASGLAAATIAYRVRYARGLLGHRALGSVRQLRSWRPTDLGEYVSGAARHIKPGSGQVLASSIRSFARFLLLNRYTRHDLSVGVPTFAHWRLSALPAVVEREHLEKLVAAVDPSTPIGRRDRAVLLCLVDLGMRAADVAAIRLDGVNISSATLRLDRPKPRRTEHLPMTRRLTAAIKEYIRRGRPSTPHPELFVIHRAPRGQPLKPLGIRGIVIRAAADIDLAGVISGTCVIRHSVASSLINAGSPIKDIADLLGHRSIDTTAIYAKVDLRSLAAVAMPWPEVIR